MKFSCWIQIAKKNVRLDSSRVLKLNTNLEKRSVYILNKAKQCAFWNLAFCSQPYKYFEMLQFLKLYRYRYNKHRVVRTSDPHLMNVNPPLWLSP
jgi:hypothetical protein